ncbi:MAG: lytic transglycosylase domain-containing protein [Rhodopila sp.]|nr:lytic transglycosylase domain-containing protein [Rhodopila sp.]
MPRRTLGRFGWLCVVVFLQPWTPVWAQPGIDENIACERAAQDAENEFGLPAGMLLAIGKVESGRWRDSPGRLVPWPWTANIDGSAEIYGSKAEAIDALTRVRAPRPTDIDVGCFQISLHYHPTAFATIADALDPVANARYAARFLRDLRERFGDWNRAVGAYHSATEPLETAYRERVMAHWKAEPPMAEADQPRWRVIPIGVTVQPAVGVWSMSSVPADATVGKLPRVITLRD